MKAAECSAPELDQINDELAKLKKEAQFNLPSRAPKTASLENSIPRVPEVPRDIARIKTIARQKGAVAKSQQDE